ncbi:hypothetical protein CAOG_003962 [Capsaspora owczarzaki ATCC 30864]|uniref:Uncharacterized protein n=1 Tax=Capsaspora owczarzaki (strain ATCC 30864) TaxID=595528 RepID=A0A0D2X2T7_CAPO3|nr:hypothetical protein CAOG_003962 [Capsaspora owczarzaki ATCC 30864]
MTADITRDYQLAQMLLGADAVPERLESYATKRLRPTAVVSQYSNIFEFRTNDFSNDWLDMGNATVTLTISMVSANANTAVLTKNGAYSAIERTIVKLGNDKTVYEDNWGPLHRHLKNVMTMSKDYARNYGSSSGYALDTSILPQITDQPVIGNENLGAISRFNIQAVSGSVNAGVRTTTYQIPLKEFSDFYEKCPPTIVWMVLRRFRQHLRPPM